MIVMIFILAIIDSHHHITMIVTVTTIIAITEPDFNARLRQLMLRRRPAFWHRPRRKQRCDSGPRRCFVGWDFSHPHGRFMNSHSCCWFAVNAGKASFFPFLWVSIWVFMISIFSWVITAVVGKYPLQCQRLQGFQWVNPILVGFGVDFTKTFVGFEGNNMSIWPSNMGVWSVKMENLKPAGAGNGGKTCFTMT